MPQLAGTYILGPANCIYIAVYVYIIEALLTVSA